jgi:hypothetical protein
MNNYIKFWLWLGAITWPVITIYSLFLPETPNNIFQIAYCNLSLLERIFWLATTPIQGMVLSFILGALFTGVILNMLYSTLVKPILHKLGIV